jgi:hypothetical protein
MMLSEDDSSDEKDRYHGSSHSKFTILQSRNVIPSSIIGGSGSNDGNQQGLQQIIMIENWISLCSSMDLIAIRNSLESIIIYRTLSWQRLLVLGPSDLVAAIRANKSSSGNDNSNNSNFDSRYHPPSSTKITPNSSSFPVMDLDSNIIAVAATACPTMNATAETKQQREATRNSSSSRTEGITCITWSPDGRALAVGLHNGQVLLFTIEGGIRLVYTTATATFQSKASTTLEPCPPPPPTTPPSTSTILTRSRTAAIRRQQQQLLLSNLNSNTEGQKVINQQPTSTAATNLVNLQEQQLSEPLDPQVIGLCWAKRISYNYPTHLLYPQEQEAYDAWA